MSFSAFLDRIRSPGLRQVALSWRAARDGRTMPAGRAIDLAPLERHRLMVWSYAYDRRTGSFAARGQQGVKPDQVRTDDDLGALSEHHRRVVDGPSLMYGHGCAFRHRGRVAIGERIALPLARDGTLADGLIGAIAYERTFGVASARAVDRPYEDLRCEFFALDPALSVVPGRDDAARADGRES